MKYRKKPVIVEAVKFDGTRRSIDQVLEFTKGKATYDEGYLYPRTFHIKTLEGTMTADIGDYIIKGIQGEFYPCKPDIFEASYEEVSE